MYFAGIDIGSLTVETAIIDDKGGLLTYNILATGANSIVAAEKSFKQALNNTGISERDLNYIVATGYGRISVPFANKTITEITCHGRGAYHLFPLTKTVVDIGGQDSKVIKLAENGKVIDFAMNDKCAAGTGRFLEVMARALEVKLGEMGELSSTSREEIPISSTCTVFAESEVVSLVAKGKPKEDIINGLHRAICNRIVGMMERVGIEEEITITGGVAKNSGIVKTLGRKTGMNINVPEESQIVGALGAALLAKKEVKGDLQ